MSRLVRVAGLLALGARGLLQAHAVYSLGLVFAGWAVDRRRTRPVLTAEPGLRIAALLVAHDEEQVIGGAVTRLCAQDYDREHYEVVVIADNCSDRTAEWARAAGATVIERHSGGARGKSAALGFGIDWVLRQGRFDAVAVFDADNHADPACLGKLAARLASGERIVQGFVDAKNPGAGWVPALSALGFWAMAALQQAPRERLGLSAPLMGTGWAAEIELCREELAALDSVTDDLELVARLALLGVRVAYEPAARVRDEKPDTLAQALRQRERWMRGRWAVVEEYVPRLLAAAFGRDGDRDLGERMRAFDACIQLAAPSVLFSGAALGAVAGVEFLRLRPARATLSLSLALLTFAAPLPELVAHRPPRRVWALYPLQPLYLLLSVPLSAAGFVRRGAATWRRTEHGASP